ncbi:hypothetical protein [Pseudanabaena sp. FACHB-2040]|uniref:hypothetical protein n=1 Tax=Pseudanabaena sp. FACHB-2040 TaxID=2692859 RepID=UPI0016862560|nr:hypothetical protein [Pseudanabaena sp. FACHB-2040]MBD2261386.1 hypothetical protein [Pseudanabaena sp. FACHB-2040]
MGWLQSAPAALAPSECRGLVPHSDAAEKLGAQLGAAHRVVLKHGLAPDNFV